MKKSEKQPAYHVLDNVIYIYRELFTAYPKTRFYVPGKVLLDVGSRVLNTSVVAMVVACITGGGGIRRFLLFSAVLFLLFTGMDALSRTVNVWGRFYYGQTQNCNFLLKLTWKSLHADYVNIEAPSMQRLMTRATHAVNMYRNGVQIMYSSLPQIVSDAMGIVLFSLGITLLDWRILVVIVVMSVLHTFLDAKARRYEQEHMDEQYKLWGRFYYLQEQTTSAGNGKEIRIYNMADWFKAGFDRVCDQNYRLASNKIRQFVPCFLSDTLLSAVRDLLAYGILTAQVLGGAIGIAEFMLGLGVISGLSGWITELTYHTSRFLNGNMMLCEYRTMMDYPNRFPREEGIPIPKEWRKTFPDLTFQNVSFQYEPEGEYVLKNLNFTIRSGEKLAIVGHNGAGKTTLVKLLCGFYHPTEGRILVGGYALDELNLEAYQELLSTVFQDINAIPVSIASNVSGRSEEETDGERVRDCLERAGLWKDVEQLERRERTNLTQCFDPEGIELSGGMMQKLMLARCMYKGAPMVILDEPTAALDPVAESRMYEEYQREARGKSAVFISHRLASTKFCDRILYLDGGRIVEEGSHGELLQKRGKYAEVFEVQSQYYREEEAKDEA